MNSQNQNVEVILLLSQSKRFKKAQHSMQMWETAISSSGKMLNAWREVNRKGKTGYLHVGQKEEEPSSQDVENIMLFIFQRIMPNVFRPISLL